MENEIALREFNRKNPFLNEYKDYLFATGAKLASVISAFKSLQRTVKIDFVVSSRANWIVCNINLITLDTEKMRFYLDDEKSIGVGNLTKAQMKFALWLKTKVLRLNKSM